MNAVRFVFAMPFFLGLGGCAAVQRWSGPPPGYDTGSMGAPVEAAAKPRPRDDAIVVCDAKSVGDACDVTTIERQYSGVCVSGRSEMGIARLTCGQTVAGVPLTRGAFFRGSFAP